MTRTEKEEEEEDDDKKEGGEGPGGARARKARYGDVGSTLHPGP